MIAAGLPALALAGGHDHTTLTPVTKTADTMTPAQPQSDGEIKKVNKESGKITVKHGPLGNLDMPPMTMVFKVKDSAMMEQVKAGDKVKFTGEKLNGALTITVLKTAT
ncbi:MAG: copper-binding protein [Bdellovibrionales bacterium]|nr:copper-binding protein [Massilia sp.]